VNAEEKIADVLENGDCAGWIGTDAVGAVLDEVVHLAEREIELGKGLGVADGLRTFHMRAPISEQNDWSVIEKQSNLYRVIRGQLTRTIRTRRWKGDHENGSFAIGSDWSGNDRLSRKGTPLANWNSEKNCGKQNEWSGGLLLSNRKAGGKMMMANGLGRKMRILSTLIETTTINIGFLQTTLSTILHHCHLEYFFFLVFSFSSRLAGRFWSGRSSKTRISLSVSHRGCTRV
jgi:hypothetical protein